MLLREATTVTTGSTADFPRLCALDDGKAALKNWNRANHALVLLSDYFKHNPSYILFIRTIQTFK